MTFHDEIAGRRREEIAELIAGRTGGDVERALRSRSLDEENLAALLSPAAGACLEETARRAHLLTVQRFGRVISLFAPLYLSNVCTNACLYCGFSARNPAERLTLTVDEAEREGRFLHEKGFRHILLVSGEAPLEVGIDYLRKVAERLRPLFASISIESYPMEKDDYEALVTAGVDGLIVYQETYDRQCYGEVHPAGRKSDYRRRLETPERGGAAGFRRIGIGALLGLSDWRVEGFFLALHARYLLRHFWRSHLTVSFPRLRPASGGFEPPFPVSDAAMVQLLIALRLFLPDAGLILSTREPAELRDHLVPLGVTSMSAGSRTDPGGYSRGESAEAQFEIADHRDPEAVADLIHRLGYEPVWKDWDAAFLGTAPEGR